MAGVARYGGRILGSDAARAVFSAIVPFSGQFRELSFTLGGRWSPDRRSWRATLGTAVPLYGLAFEGLAFESRPKSRG